MRVGGIRGRARSGVGVGVGVRIRVRVRVRVLPAHIFSMTELDAVEAVSPFKFIPHSLSATKAM